GSPNSLVVMPALSRRQLRGPQYRGGDVLVPGGAAQVATDRLARLVPGRVRVLAQVRRDGRDEPRRAEPALQPVTVLERLLYRPEPAVGGTAPFDRGHPAAVHADREQQARAHRRPVHEDGAGAAHAVLAAHVRPGVPEVVAQAVGQQPARGYPGGTRCAVDDEPDVVKLLAHAATAPRQARSVSTRTSWRR